MDAGESLLDGIFCSVRRALTEESRRRPQYPSSNRRRAAAGNTATTADDLARRSSLSNTTTTKGAADGTGVQRSDAGDTCTAEGDGCDIDSPAAAVGYRHRRLCEAEHGTMAAVLATRAGGSEARDSHEDVLHREIKVGSLGFDFCHSVGSSTADGNVNRSGSSFQTFQKMRCSCTSVCTQRIEEDSKHGVGTQQCLRCREASTRH